MKLLNILLLQFGFSLVISLSSFLATANNPHEDFVHCLLRKSDNATAMSQIIYTPNNPNYSSILLFYTENLRFSLPNTPKPQVILTPVKDSQIQTAICCSKKHGLQMRIRSGGHDFEGSSYVSNVTFFILDMFNYRSVRVDPKTRTAWVGAGATLGETYYAINKTNSSLAFAAGYWPTVAIGGHVSGGGYGPLVRQYGLAADNVVDARMIDAKGRILDRKSMGEDVYWAVGGGMGGSYGVILTYKIALVDVSQKVTAFRLNKTLEQNATQLVYKWQFVAPKLPRDLILSLQLTSINSTQKGKKTIQATFISVYQGGAEQLLSIMLKQFPELGVTIDDCVRLNWLEYFPFHLALPINMTATFLQSRVPPVPKNYLKGKSDFAQKPIPIEGLEKLWKQFFKIDNPPGRMEWTPFGGRMDEIPSTEIPFPYRSGNIFILFQVIEWNGPGAQLQQQRLAWIRQLHSIIGQYVAKNPRRSYSDYRDLDLGVNNPNYTSIQVSRIWGAAYFDKNFDRLVKAKTEIDPRNYFNNEQSIPPAVNGRDRSWLS
ncbi:hypothetical protein ACH5RR_028897 [Cinchona calisaya]|uniref:FAD-binding PCMH-type domain-containing protein n=1 Tax=Cinchona calisaya TaxID=153742 RepID=A0ABD2YQ36_9GENT